MATVMGTHLRSEEPGVVGAAAEITIVLNGEDEEEEQQGKHTGHIRRPVRMSLR